MKNTTVTPNRSWMTLVVIAVLAAVSVAVCGGPAEAPITVLASAQAADLTLEPCTYEADKVEYAADCGTLVVPENRSDPNSRLIELPVIRVRALGDNPTEPIFWFAGGPGSSNMHFSRLEGLIENHNIVMVGYRGVDGSVVLDCPEVTEAIRNAPGDLLAETSLDSFTAAYTRCAERLHSEGVDTDDYTMTEVVDDMEAARIALGYERINLIGGSYGTRLEMIYAWMYPDSLHRVIMIAVNPPGHFVWEPEKVDEQLEYYAELCAQDAECSARTDDLAETMRNVSRNMPERWLFIPINEGTVKVLTYVMLMGGTSGDPAAPVPLSAPAAFDMWLAAEQGDPSGMALGSMLGNMLLPMMGTWGEKVAKASSADFDPTRDYRAEMNPPDSILGSPLALFMWGMASGWPVNHIPEEYRQVQPSDVEMLLVGGNIDMSIPQDHATNELLPYLSNGQQVILSEFGHTEDFWSLQPEARVHLLTTFFDTGEVDDSLYTYHPVDFHVGLGYPAMAKIALAVVVLVIVIVVAVVWFIVRLVRRRRAAQVSS